MFESSTNPMFETPKEDNKESTNSSHTSIINSEASKKPNPLLKQKSKTGGAAGWAKLKQMHKQGKLATETATNDTGAIKPLSPPSKVADVVLLKKEEEEQAKIKAEAEQARLQSESATYDTTISNNEVVEETSTYVLPEGWYSEWDETNQAYYYVNQATGESQWESPE
jgi:hypothetical protein